MSTQDWHPPDHDRTRARSSDKANTRIDRLTRGVLDEVGESPERVRQRLAALDREWDLDRALLAVFPVLGSITASNAIRSARRKGRMGFWGALLFTQLGFLLYHAVRGWCPPVAVLRPLGFRTWREICEERRALEKRLSGRDLPERP